MTDDSGSAPPASPRSSPWGPPPDSPPPTTGAGKPKWKQILIMIVSGVVLAVGGCALFLMTINEGEGPSVIGALIFAGGLLLVFAAGVMAIVHIVRALLAPRKN